jgi:hypothetical protein
MVEGCLVAGEDATLADGDGTWLRTVDGGVNEADSCLAAKDGETAPRVMSGVMITSAILWLCSFVWAADEQAAREDGMNLLSAFEEVEGVGLSIPVFLASRGKPVPIAKKQML